MKRGPPQSSPSGPPCLSSWECRCQSCGLIPDPLADSERSPASLCLSPVEPRLIIVFWSLSNHIAGKWCSYLFGGQGPRGFVWLFTEMCVVHVGSQWGDGACAQLELMLVLVSQPRVDILTHKALHRLHHVLEVLGVGCWVALQIDLNLQTTNGTGWVWKCTFFKWQTHVVRLFGGPGENKTKKRFVCIERNHHLCQDIMSLFVEPPKYFPHFTSRKYSQWAQ